MEADGADRPPSVLMYVLYLGHVIIRRIIRNNLKDFWEMIQDVGIITDRRFHFHLDDEASCGLEDAAGHLD